MPTFSPVALLMTVSPTVSSPISDLPRLKKTIADVSLT
jgi:hypothetical protein